MPPAPNVEASPASEWVVGGPRIVSLLPSIKASLGAVLPAKHQARLERELKARSNGAPVKVIAESGRRHAAWRGASILAELYAFSEAHDFDSGFSIPWITSEAYSVRVDRSA